MPVRSDSFPSILHPPALVNGPPRTSLIESQADRNCIHIGLVNNMSGAALQATERQIRGLLEAAAGPLTFRLSLFALPEIPRSDEARRHIAGSYSCLNKLWSGRLDGIIVTGADPLSSNVKKEPFWESLARLIDWAEHNTYSAIWSCLAAHAALLHGDGIERRPLSEKLFGVFECAKVMDDPLTVGTPACWRMPHSRWNEVPEQALAQCGYRILTRSAHAGVDAFLRQRKSLFVLFQGHPEYAADSLLFEYGRDIRRFLRREKDCYPLMPRDYFDRDTALAFAALKERAFLNRREELVAELSAALRAATLRDTWRPVAISIYRNWLRYLASRKEMHLNNRPRRIECR